MTSKKRLGRPRKPLEQRIHTIAFGLPMDLHGAVTRLAEEAGVNVSQCLRNLLEPVLRPTVRRLQAEARAAITGAGEPLVPDVMHRQELVQRQEVRAEPDPLASASPGARAILDRLPGFGVKP